MVSINGVSIPRSSTVGTCLLASLGIKGKNKLFQIENVARREPLTSAARPMPDADNTARLSDILSALSRANQNGILDSLRDTGNIHSPGGGDPRARPWVSSSLFLVFFTIMCHY